MPDDLELTHQIPPPESSEDDGLEVPSWATATNALSRYLQDP